MSATSKICKDHGDREGCLGEADERFTMDFSDIGEPPIHWCAHCGPEAHMMSEALGLAFKTRPGFAAELEAAINKVKDERH